MKRLSVLLATTLLFAGCEESENFWTAETCNQRLEADIVNFEEYQTEFSEIVAQMETEARRGNAEAAAANKRSAESRIEATLSLLRFFDNNTTPVCEGKFRPDLLAKVETARQFAKNASVGTAEAEGMPDLRVSGVQSAFVPYVLNERGACVGPYLDLVFTVTNQGADFPRPVDLQTYTERAQRPAEELPFFTAVAEFDFGGDMKTRLDFTVTGASGGAIPAGGSLNIPAKLKVEHNWRKARVTGYVQGAAFLKIGNDSAKHEMEVDVPQWDIYTFSHMVLQSKDEDGKSYLGAKGTVTNLGSTPTPGPIQASFVIQEAETGRHIESWSGTTDAPVSGNTDLYAKIPFSGKLPEKIRVQSSIIPLCPDGTAGYLSDGDTTNNVRELQQR